VECAREILGETDAAIVKKFDQMRKNRHEAIYDIGIISRSEAEEAVKVAGKFIAEVSHYIKEINSQKELF
jgi:hypothetical protein